MPRNLILTGGPYHPFASSCEALDAALSEVGIASNVTTDIGAGLRQLDNEQYDLLTVYALRWSMREPRSEADRQAWAFTLSDGDRARIEGHLAAGRGILALHTAGICFDDWPRWREIVGAGWVWGSSHHPPHGTVAVRMTGIAHSITSQATNFSVDDEAYTAMDLISGVQVLATVNAESQLESSPCLWTREVSNGRVVYDALGHDAASLNHPIHREIVQRSARWCIRQL
jgi:type 1 glutamine amidotransferase